MDILLVEDNDIQRWLIQTNLEREGHTIDTAKTGSEALKLFYRGYDCILLNLCLNDLSGIQVVRFIRERECEYRRNLVFGVSPMAERVRGECLRAGFNDVFKKPLDAQILETIMRRIDVEKRYRYVSPTSRRNFGGFEGIPSR